MATIEIEVRPTGERWSAPLAARSIIGRDRSCTHRIDLPYMPHMWVEVRWFGAEGWGVKLLGDDGFNRVPGEPMPERPQWRRPRARSGSRFLLLRQSHESPKAQVIAAITDLDSPPRPFAMDIVEGRVLDDRAFRAAFRADEAGVFSRGGDARLADGQEIELDGRQVRLHLPDEATHTALPVFSLDAPEAELEVEWYEGDSFLARVTVGPAQKLVALRRTAILIPWVLARNRSSGGGFCGIDEAYATLDHLFSVLEPSRPEWTISIIQVYRQRIESDLLAKGIGIQGELFEKRGGEVASFRLRLPRGDNAVRVSDRILAALDADPPPRR